MAVSDRCRLPTVGLTITLLSLRSFSYLVVSNNRSFHCFNFDDAFHDDGEEAKVPKRVAALVSSNVLKE